MINNFNSKENPFSCYISAAVFGISQLYEKYYGKSYTETISFNYQLGTINKGTFASIREQYGYEGPYEAYYIVTPVIQVYKMLKAAEKKGYPLFEKNIREYLGDNVVNNGIVATLKSPEDRKNFMYYNNGITVICEEIKASELDASSRLRLIPLVNPQIVNGCQTANSIKKVLESISEDYLEDQYRNVYVMIKALVISNPEEKTSKKFYNDVVKFTNTQNAISEKAFTSNLDVFYRMQTEFQKRGFLLLVKPSDKNQLKQNLTKKEKADLLMQANCMVENIEYPIVNFTDLQIPLEKILQVFTAFIKNGHYAFTKKNLVLRQGSELFDIYCSQINKYLTIEHMIHLYYFYKRAEIDRKDSEDRHTPVPYYVIGFLGALIHDLQPESIKLAMDFIFDSRQNCDEAYRYLVALSKMYRRDYERNHPGSEGEYNIMIKRPIDDSCLQYVINSVNDANDWQTIKQWAYEKWFL